MNKTLFLTIVCSAVLVGCMTVQMPELSRSHPAHPEAEAASVSAWPSILQLREEPLVAPPLPIPTDGSGLAPLPEGHRGHSTAGIEVGSALYICPMHKEITSDSPDSCSKCGMDLVKDVGSALYVCPMHKEITSASADSCSKCGMDLVKKGGA